FFAAFVNLTLTTPGTPASSVFSPNATVALFRRSRLASFFAITRRTDTVHGLVHVRRTRSPFLSSLRSFPPATEIERFTACPSTPLGPPPAWPPVDDLGRIMTGPETVTAAPSESR